MKNTKKIKVGVIFGGQSGEHEVSIVSAKSVIKALDKSKYQVVPIGITKEGKWIAGSESIKLLESQTKNLPFKSVLTPDPTERGITKISNQGLEKSHFLSASVKEIDVVFPVLHGTNGEDGVIQGLLELANIPYVGSNVLGSSLAMDKIVSKQVLQNMGLPVVPYVWFLFKDYKKNSKDIIQKIEKKLKYPVFVKPANLGSSVGISKAHDKEELLKGIKEASVYDRKIVVEQGINNVREIETAVLGNDDPIVAVPGEIIPSNEFYDYDAKYVDGQSTEQIPAKLNKKIYTKIQKMALEAFKGLNLSGLARIDFLVTKKTNKIYINEANTLPGFTSISMYPKMWAASGLSYSNLVDKLVKLAIARHKEQSKISTQFKPKEDWYK